ncbi:MAG: class I SAM-dependent DNA methyltransferase [Verrucomicrobia bacterium]|nr:class I SAM-dependent DNA methyltransferase [Verrucomicrobiota bacterium]
MPISWNEIRHNAIQFSRNWAGVTSESAEKQTYWNEFFQVFGIKRRVVASFEEAVKKISGEYGRIDLFWPGIMLVEHKSFGEDLHKAETQAFQYIRDLANDPARHDDIPRYIIVSDFARIAIHDLEPEEQRDLPPFDTKRGKTHVFPLAEFHKNVQHFAFIPGYKQHTLTEENPVNIKAAEMLGELHDALEAGGFSGDDLEQFLVRVLFCLFAEDTGLFPRRAFDLYLEENAFTDMVNIGASLEHLFQVLNTPEDKRQQNLSTELRQFPYVNGDLFAERLNWPDFGDDARQALRQCCGFDWSRISPAIFGSLFQSIMDDKKRRQIGAHYTSERDILKVVRSLFLDELRAEFESIKADRSTRRRARLEEFHAKLCRLTFFDPACGCGNFLVITYRELRLLELEVLLELFRGQRELTLDEINKLSQVDVDQFYGIEIGEWPARIAEVALWLMDHQMNLKVSEAFGQLYQRLPLKKSPHIHCANALRLDWKTVLPPDKCSYVLGNPPFVGKKEQTPEQKADMDSVWGELKGAGILDYVTCWYKLAGDYTQRTQIRCAFVSTNSICQGEQVGVLWSELFTRFHMKIHFAHTTFAWESEARGKAHVHVVIIGFGAFDVANKLIFEYDTPKGEPHAVSARNISPYLTDGSDVVLTSRRDPINDAPKISYGSMMIDKDRKAGDEAGLLLTPRQRKQLLAECPDLQPFIRRIYGGDEFLNDTERYCLWLVDAPTELITNCPALKARIDGVRDFRRNSGREQTRELAMTPALFGEIRQPTTRYLLFPKVSSESRPYLPIGFVSPDIIASGSALIVPGATLFHFGILSSAMHNAWMRRVAGRMKSDYQYSVAVVYNNFPWPENVSAEKRELVEEKARTVLAAREKFMECGDSSPLSAGDLSPSNSPGAPASPRAAARGSALPTSRQSGKGGDKSPHSKTATLADLYNPLNMKPVILKAHAALDRAVERCYRREPFHSDRERVEFLFALYEKLTAPLLPVTKSRRRKTPPLYARPPAKPQPGITPEKAYGDAAHFYGKEEGPPYRTGS